MLQNNLKYSFNGFSDNCQVYAKVGHTNQDIQSKKSYIMTNYMYFKMMHSSCYLHGQGSEKQVSTHIVSFCKWSTQNKNKQKPYRTWVLLK